MAEQNLPKDVQQALENLTGTDKEFLKTVVSEKGELNEEALENVSGGVSLSEAGTTALNWLKNNYGKVAMSAGVVLPFVAGGIAGYIWKDEIKEFLLPRENGSDDSEYTENVSDLMNY